VPKGGGFNSKNVSGAKAKTDAIRNFQNRKRSYFDHSTPNFSLKFQLEVFVSPRHLAKLTIIVNGTNLNGDGNENLSQYKSGPNPFSKFKFKKPENFIRKNVIVKEKKLSHLYDRHAESYYNIKKPRNK